MTTDWLWAPIMSGMQITLVKRLMAFEALTLAIVSPIHLVGGSYGAGFAEGWICIALLAGLASGRRGSIAVLSFAVFGFLVGLRFTVSGGEALDLVYHATMLPVLGATLLLLTRTRERHRSLRDRSEPAVTIRSTPAQAADAGAASAGAGEAGGS